VLTLAAAAVILLNPQKLSAHSVEAGFVQVDISYNASGTITVTWPQGAWNMEAVFTDGCKSRQYSYGIETVVTANCAGSKNMAVHFKGLQRASKDLLIRIKSEQQQGKPRVLILNWQNSTVYLDKTESSASVYFLHGVKHIFTGLDHLLFVLTLLLIVNGYKRLALTVTAFTAAHSITLALSVFNIITLPKGAVEAAIALSIMFLAVEYIKQQQGFSGLTTSHPWTVSFAVGLLHGLGFADALTSLGLERQQIPLALLTFNAGVEAGQLIFIAVALLFLNMAHTIAAGRTVKIKYFAAYAIGSTASVWFIERVINIV
jgi:hydrogenase/urease accessory protein HupE